MTTIRQMVIGTLLALGVTAPAAADVKAGVDAWERGDYAAALAEWRPLAIAGDADAQFNMGQAYKLGRGVPIDLAVAEDWFRKAAEQGHAKAGDNYGLALFQNNKRDAARPWLEKSAARGEPRSQYVLGTMFFNGDTEKKDWVRAYALMTRATASADLPQAAATLAQMDKYVSPGDRQKGAALARQYESDAARTPLAAVGTPGQAAGREPPKPAPVKPTPVKSATPPSPRPAVAAPLAPGGDWRVQLGAFGQPGGAQRLWGQLSGRFAGRRPYYVKAGTLTRLLVGPFDTQAEAARACACVSPCVPTRG